MSYLVHDMTLKMFKKNLYYFLIILLIFFFDRITKILVVKNLDTSGNDFIEVTSFFSLNLIWNQGIAFGLFSLDQGLYYNSITVIILVITAIIFWMIIKSEGLEKIGFILIFGGSLGNIFDRIMYKSVPDFIDFHINNFHWFIFNVADIFITFGVILLIYLELIIKVRK